MPFTTTTIHSSRVRPVSGIVRCDSSRSAPGTLGATFVVVTLKSVLAASVVVGTASNSVGVPALVCTIWVDALR